MALGIPDGHDRGLEFPVDGGGLGLVLPGKGGRQCEEADQGEGARGNPHPAGPKGLIAYEVYAMGTPAVDYFSPPR
jgi:hypothetical protein